MIARLAVLLAVAVCALALAACGASGGGAAPAPATTAGASSAGTCPTGTPRADRTAHLRPGVRALAADGERVFAANAERGIVSRIDATSGRVLQHLTGFRTPVDLSLAYGQLWVADRDAGRVMRIDPATGRRRVAADIGVPVALAPATGLIWMLSLDDGSLYALDGKRQSGLRVFDLGLPQKAPGAMAALGGTLFTLGYEDRSVLSVNGAIKRVTTGGVQLDANSVSDIAAGAGAAWVADPKDLSILRVDAGTRAISAFHAPRPMRPSALTVGPCGVWAVDPSGLVARFDPATQKPVGDPLDVGSSGGDITTDGADGVWVSDPVGGRVVHVAP